VYSYLVVATRRSDVCPRVKREKEKMKREEMGRTEPLLYVSHAVDVVIGLCCGPKFIREIERVGKSLCWMITINWPQYTTAGTEGRSGASRVSSVTYAHGSFLLLDVNNLIS